MFSYAFWIQPSINTKPWLSLTVRGNRPGKPVQHEIKYLCKSAREIFMGQPILLELEAPMTVCGQSVQVQALVSTAPMIYLLIY